jgi:hypothetical protein
MECFRPSHVVFDWSYDSGQLIDAIHNAGAESMIPPQSRRRDQRLYDKVIHCKPNRAMLQSSQAVSQFRRFATRYD